MPPRCPEGSWKYIRASCSRRRRSRNSRACSLTRWPTLPSTTLPACSGSRNRCRSRCLRRSFWGCSRRARIPTWPRRSLPVQEPPASSHNSITPAISSARPTGSAFSSCNRRASTSAAWARSSNGCRKRRGCTRTTRRPICALTRSPASASPTCRIARKRLPTSRRPTASSSPSRAPSCAPSRACRARPSLISQSWCASIATPTRPARARAREFSAAAIEVESVRKLVGAHPMVELLAARIRTGAGDAAGALEVLRAALGRAPNYRPLHYAYVEALQESGQHQAALAWLAELVKSYPRDARLYGMQAKSYAASGKRLLHHQALAENYVLQGTLPAAIEQLQLAQKSGDGDFYQLSAVEARLRDLRVLQAEEAKRR